MLRMVKNWINRSFILKTRFRTQLLVSFVILTLVIMTVMTISFIFLVKRSVFEQNERKLQTLVRQITKNIDIKMVQYKDLSNNLYANPILAQRLQAVRTADPMEIYHSITDFLVAMQGSNRTSIDRIVIYENGSMLFKDGYAILAMSNELRTAVYDKIWLSADNALLKETWKDDRGQRVFSIYSRISQTILVTGGLIELRLYETDLYALIHEASREHAVYIVSQSDVVLSASDRSIVGQNVSSLSEFHQSIINSAFDQKRIRVGQDEYVTVHHQSSYGYKVIAAIQSTQLLNEFYPVFWSVLFLSTAAIALALLLTLILSNRLDKRMGLLNQKIQYLRSGKFDQVIEIPGFDEFSVLSYAIDDTSDDLAKLIHDIKLTGEQRRRAEMKALRSQINAHFLFNSLSTIKWLAATYDAQDIKEAVDVLSSFLRITLTREADFISVRNELDHVQAYVYLQKLRYHNDVDITFTIDPDVLPYQTIKLVLQPMIENALAYGRMQDGRVLHIDVMAGIEQDRLIFKVRDDGRGMSPERLQEVRSGTAKTTHSGYGITNIEQRLLLCCGEDYKLQIDSMPDQGTEITITQPLISYQESGEPVTRV